jgi:hypothetical protein
MNRSYFYIYFLANLDLNSVEVIKINIVHILYTHIYLNI